MNRNFDWDEQNIRHIARHDVTPEEAEEVLANNPFEAHEEFVEDEPRTTQIGLTNNLRCLTVVTTWRGEKLRVVTAFDATPSMRRAFARKSEGRYE